MCRFQPILLMAIAAASNAIRAEDSGSSPQFETHVRSILKEHCFHCHGEEDDPEGELDLRLVRLIKQGGESGTAVVPYQPDESLLWQRLRDGEMPPDESKLLSQKDLSVIRDWIAAGATTVRPEADSLDEDSFITREELSHWSFQPIVRPEIPKIVSSNSVANPIDVFLLTQLERKGFGFSPPAAKHTLLRRVYLDLLGLPPTPTAVAEFHSNDDADAWPRTVDELLDSEHYGERWAQHWLDVAGYADSEGYNDADAERPHAWRYRDYVIQSFNEDKPFDRFIQEQLAGDEMITSSLSGLSDMDAQLLTATGFLRMAPDGTGGAVPNANVARNETIADTIKIVSSSLMGMTVGCAQCHDHRYDPISQADYYRFRAIFEPAFDWQKWRPPVQRLVSLYTDQDRETAATIEAEAKEIDADRTKKQTEFINATFEKELAKLPTDIHDAARTAHATSPGKRTKAQKSLFQKHPNLNVTSGSLYLYDKKAADTLKAMADQAQKLRATKPKENFVRALTEVEGRVPVTHLFYRGDHEQPKQELFPAGLTVISKATQVDAIPVDVEGMATTGRRLALAKRLTNRNHPLTARVIVNRIWMHHFGRGLVSTPNDFGILGIPPTHPKLLDWLAAELIESGWSLKYLHRLILTSNAWKQQICTDAQLAAEDPENQLYGGANLIRLDAEAIRDSLLSISGRLNRSAFGPAVPVMADRVGRWVIGKENLNAGRPGDKIDMKGEEFRRSIYIQVRRSRPLSVLDTFDRPVMSPNCDKRRPSTGSTQSLLMMNSDLLLDYSRFMAERLETEAPGERKKQIQRAWQLVYSRLPDSGEIAVATRFLEEQTAIFEEQPAYQARQEQPPKHSAGLEATALMCQMLFSSNEFLYVD